jgi:arginyl-tRNA synthetase
MSSRKGGVFRTIELIDEIADAITAQFENSNHEQAQKLAISALIINDTKGDISKDVNLDIPTITKMNGDTGVYIQYTAVRIRSLMQKLNEERITNFSNIKLKTESLSELQKKILFESSLLPLKIKISLELLKPHIITQYLLNLSALLNRWYNDSPKAVEMKDEERKQNLLRLHSVLIILEKTLNILHMPRVEKM